MTCAAVALTDTISDRSARPDGASSTNVPTVRRASQRSKPSRARRRSAAQFGEQSENETARYLYAGGYTILGRRVRTGKGEVDVVAVADDTVAFVEVKARRKGWDGLCAVDARKQTRLCRAADAWLSKNELYSEHSLRFDIALIWPGGRIEYIENAFDYTEPTGFEW